MKNKSTGYYFINITILVVTLILLGCNLHVAVLKNIIKEEKAYLLLAILMATAVYSIKGLRLYLIMLERRIAIRRFMKLYVKTTLVNFLLPFKSGEVFKIYCYGYEMKDYKISFFCILVERYFDTVPLLVLLYAFTYLSKAALFFVVSVLTLFIVFITVIYSIFPYSYKYMNKFLIMATESERGVWALATLDKFQKWYGYVKELVSGRFALVLTLSSLTWIMEYGILICLAAGLKETFSMLDFVEYMNSIFVGSGNLYVYLYVGLSILLFAVFSCLLYGISIARREKK